MNELLASSSFAYAEALSGTTCCRSATETPRRRTPPQHQSRCATLYPDSPSAGSGAIVCPQTQKLCCWRVPTRDCHTGQSLPVSAMGRPHRGVLAFVIASHLPAKLSSIATVVVTGHYGQTSNLQTVYYCSMLAISGTYLTIVE
ncbi:UPF0246 protein [Dirofilaria immitis]